MISQDVLSLLPPSYPMVGDSDSDSEPLSLQPPSYPMVGDSGSDSETDDIQPTRRPLAPRPPASPRPLTPAFRTRIYDHVALREDPANKWKAWFGTAKVTANGYNLS